MKTGHSSAAPGEPIAAGDAHPPEAVLTIAFREQQPADAAIVRRIHAAHWRAPASLDLPPALLTLLLDQQHDSQERHITARHPFADRRMILAHGVVVGRVCLDRSATPWHLVDLALLEDAQGHGIGRKVLRQLCDEAARAGVAIVLDVARDNLRAEALYRLSGFVASGEDDDTHHRLVWTAVDRANH